jgi:hypothetical protein
MSHHTLPTTTLLVLLALTGCKGGTDTQDSAACPETTWSDVDQDGYVSPSGDSDCAATAEDDCDDSDPNIHPGAAEVPGNGQDDDCDGEIDEGATNSSTDEDGDGYSVDGGDCDDTSSAVNPDAAEVCDGIDNNCDGGVDVGATDMTTWYTDGDGDGVGDAASAVQACEAPVGTVALGDDCDDSDARFYPGAAETDCADPNDYNCDGSTGYADADADGFAACQECDDKNGAVNPDATEVCDGVDSNCDTIVDEGLLTTYYGDADGDGYGDAAVTQDACDVPEGYSTTSGDTDDTDSTVYPGSLANDDDGDGYSEEEGDTNDADFSVNPENDNDGDGFRLLDGDCDDDDANVYPAAWEQCNGVDDDCDGAVDEDVIDRFIYPDDDGDGFGDASGAVLACVVTVGTVIDNTDCDDAESTINPAAPELCNGVDDDCDGLADDADSDAKPDATLWYYPDRDGDGYVDSSDPDFTYTKACGAPSDYASQTGDCDDDNQLVYPGASEVCDGERNDCTISSAYWTTNAEMLEAEKVSYIAESGDLITDYSGLLPTTPGSPTTVTLTANGSLNFCADPAGTTWYVAIEADNLSVDIAGLRGSSLTELSGDGVGRPIAVTGSTADVSGLTLADGYANGGGGLYAYYTALTLSDVVLLNNDSNGGYHNAAALTLDDSQATLTDVLISGSLSGYGLACYSSTISATRLTVEDSAQTGVYLYACNSTLFYTDISNNAQNGLYINAYGTTTISHSNIDHNQRGIYALHAGTVSIADSSINNNGHTTGAGIYGYYSGDFTLTDTKVESNHGDAGGAVYLNWGVNLSMTGTSACAIQNNVDAYANAAHFGSSWTGTLTSSGCVWDGGQDIYYASTATTEDTSTLPDPLNFTCTTSGCL